ncbi:hypothetical protein [Maribacter sp. 2308TA10-17]|uniref:hypothetical protein n=1 Tax=Maribacter sp. 2308TA10-17 TaxID=3386276 RepID=UPI0039BCA3A2
MFRNTILLIFMIFTFSGKAQLAKDQTVDETLKTVIRDILQLSADANVSEINKKYIHPEFGVYDVFRIGVPDTFEQHFSISFSFPAGQNSSRYPNLMEITEIAIPKEVVKYNAIFDCNEMVWDRAGLFVTDSISYPRISKILKQPVFETSKFSKSFYKQVKHIEEKSHRVVFTKLDIVFYLTKIDGKWYLTLFDRVTTDCSA